MVWLLLTPWSGLQRVTVGKGDCADHSSQTNQTNKLTKQTKQQTSKKISFPMFIPCLVGFASHFCKGLQCPLQMCQSSKQTNNQPIKKTNKLTN